MKKLTSSQLAALRNLAAGKESSYGLSGRSAYGGHTQTMWALFRAGLATNHGDITQAGLDAIKQEKAG